MPARCAMTISSPPGALPWARVDMTERPIRLDCVVRGLMPKAALGLGAVSAEKLFGGLGGKGAIEQLLELGRVLTRFDPRALRIVERDSGAR